MTKYENVRVYRKTANGGYVITEERREVKRHKKPRKGGLNPSQLGKYNLFKLR